MTKWMEELTWIAVKKIIPPQITNKLSPKMSQKSRKSVFQGVRIYLSSMFDGGWLGQNKSDPCLNCKKCTK